MDALSHEVWRILKAPYAVSLQRLHTLLSSIEQHRLRRWATGRCHIEALAIAVLANLQESPFALAILRKLSCILSFRDAILDREPNLLATLLEKATGSEQGYSQCATTCVALLSTPTEHPLPAEISGFFAAIVERVIDTPSADNLRLVESILSGIDSRVLEILSPESLIGLQRRLIRLVSHLDQNTHDTNAFCLAVLAQISLADQPADISSSISSLACTDISSANKPDPFEPARNLFADKNIPKILDFVFGRARLACSPSVSETVDRRLEFLRLCSKTIRPTSEDAGQSWLSKRSSLIKKLNEHLTRDDLDSEVRCSAFDLMATVHYPKLIPVETHKAIGCLLSACRETCYSHTVVDDYIMHLDEHALAAELLRLLRLAVQQELPSPRGLSILNAAIVLVKGLAAKSTICHGLRQKVLYSLSTNVFSEPLQRLSAFTPSLPHVEHDKHCVCPTYYTETQQKFCRELCCFILQTGLHAGYDELSLDGSLFTGLLRKNFNSIGALSKCDFSPLAKSCKNSVQVSLFEAGGTPQELPSRQWRDQLANSLSRNADYQHQHIIKTMSEVCRDLEARCDNAEQPLREEQARTLDLRQKLEEADTRNTELTSQDEERGQVLEGLKTNVCRWTKEANAADERSKALLADLAALQQDLERTKEKTARAVEGLSEAARHQDLSYLATLKGKDDECQKQTDRIEALEAQTSDLNQSLKDKQRKEVIQTDQIDHLEKSLASKLQQLEEAQALSKARIAEMDQLQAVNVQLEASVSAANSKAEETVAERDNLSSKLHAQASSFKSEGFELQKRYDYSVAAKADEVEKLLQGHQTTVQNLRKDREQAEKLAERAARAKNAKIKDIEGKMSRLRRQREEQAKVITEFQDSINRMTSVTSRLCTEQLPLDSPAREPMAGNPDPGGLMAFRDVQSPSPSKGDLTTSFSSSISSRSSGPTPKRPKTGNRQSFRLPLTNSRRPPHVQSNRRATTGYPFKAQRQALQDLGPASQNEMLLTPTQPMTQPLTQKVFRRPTSVAAVQSKENMSTEEEADFGDMSFNGNDIITSTHEGRLVIVNDEQSMKRDYDETTAEF